MIEFIDANWLWVLLIAAMVLIHRRGGCGSHGSHGTHSSDGEETTARGGRAGAGGVEHGSHR